MCALAQAAKGSVCNPQCLGGAADGRGAAAWGWQCGISLNLGAPSVIDGKDAITSEPESYRLLSYYSLIPTAAKHRDRASLSLALSDTAVTSVQLEWPSRRRTRAGKPSYVVAGMVPGVI